MVRTEEPKNEVILDIQRSRSGTRSWGQKYERKTFFSLIAYVDPVVSCGKLCAWSTFPASVGGFWRSTYTRVLSAQPIGRVPVPRVGVGLEGTSLMGPV